MMCFYVFLVEMLDNIYIYNGLYGNGEMRRISVHLVFLGGKTMRIILDTEKKTITVPWNYTEKIAEFNRIAEESGGTKKRDFKGYLDECWKYAMDRSDTQLKTAQKPVRKKSSED